MILSLSLNVDLSTGMNALSVALSLLVLLPSLSIQNNYNGWAFHGPSDRYAVPVNGPPRPPRRGRGYGFSGPSSHNKWWGDRGPPGGHGPPGLAAGGPPGLAGGGPPGLNKNRPSGWQTAEMPSKGGGYVGSSETTHKPQSNVNIGDPYRPNYGQQPGINNQLSTKQCSRNDEFQCGSNECLPHSVKCDTKIDCRDASDETFCIVNRNPDSGCILPKHPVGGYYVFEGCGQNCNKRSGDIVPRNSVLTYGCRNNYVLNGNTITVCVNNEWYKPPSCVKICPALSSSSVDISCRYQGETVSCSEPVLPGTRATLSCKSSYKLPLTNDPAYREITCLDDGLWDRPVFRCLPECGTSIAHGNTLIVNGFEAQVGIFPWHLAVYRKKDRTAYEQICAGTLISNNLVVSAAHCFYDEVYNKLRDASDYAVAAGKHYRDWNVGEQYAQRSLLESIRSGNRYMGARGNFAEDIALLKLRTPFTLTFLVRPICMDWDNVYEKEQLQVGQTGKVVGWGKNIRGVPSASLQEVDMPYVPYDQCLSVVPADFRGYLTTDKFCAGRLNGSSVCEGDSGGGLCFVKNGVWYLRGIVSVSPAKEDSCDYNSYVGFTRVSYFRDWIRDAFIST